MVYIIYQQTVKEIIIGYLERFKRTSVGKYPSHEEAVAENITRAVLEAHGEKPSEERVMEYLGCITRTLNVMKREGLVKRERIRVNGYKRKKIVYRLTNSDSEIEEIINSGEDEELDILIKSLKEGGDAEKHDMKGHACEIYRAALNQLYILYIKEQKKKL